MTGYPRARRPARAQTRCEFLNLPVCSYCTTLNRTLAAVWEINRYDIPWPLGQGALKV